jgi:hypothetical protein
MRERKSVYMVFGGRPEEKKPLGRTRRRWEDNIKMYFCEVGWGMDWIDVAQVVGCCECRNIPSDSIKCGEFSEDLLAYQEVPCSIELVR